MKTVVLFTHSKDMYPGVYTYTTTKSTEPFTACDNLVLGAIVKAFNAGCDLFVVVVTKSLEECLDGPKISDSLIKAFDDVLGGPADIEVRFMGNSSHMLRLGRFAVELFNKVNKVECLVGSTVVATED